MSWGQFYWHWFKGAVWESLGLKDLVAGVGILGLAVIKHFNPTVMTSELLWEMPAGLFVLARVFLEPYRMYRDVEKERDALDSRLSQAPRIVVDDFGISELLRQK